MEPASQIRGPFPTVYRMAMEAWASFRGKVNTLIILAAIGAVLFGLGRWVGTGVLTVPSLLQAKDYPLTFPGGAAAVVGYVALMLAYTYTAYAMLVVVTSSQVVGAGQALSAAASKVLHLLWISILVGVVVAGGFTLIIVPGLIFLVWFFFATYVYMSQGIGGLRALRLSKEYVRGAYWRLWWCFLAFGICAGIIFAVCAGLIGAVGTVVGGPVGVALALVSLFASTLITSYCVCYIYRVFQALQYRRGVITDAPKATAPLVIGLVGFCLLLVFAIIGAAAPKQEAATQSNATSTAGILQEVRLKALQLAIAEYHKEKGSYPATLQSLVPDYVDAGAVNLADFTYAPSSGGAKVCLLAEPEQCLVAS